MDELQRLRKSLSDEDRENMELIEKLAEIATRHLKIKGVAKANSLEQM